MTGFVVAIDGPAASGKSTTARLAAERLGFLYLDTGAMYRALTWKTLHEGVDPGDPEAVAALVASTRLALEPAPEGNRVRVDGRDVTDRLRDPGIDRAVSCVARIPAVRREMVRLQREAAGRGPCVVEGRDIGTVVFPDAPVKIFLEASLDERTRRRARELDRRGVVRKPGDLAEEIRARDAMDAGREDSPLRPAEDAVRLDTTGLTIEGQVAEVVRVVERALARGGGPAPGGT